MDIKKTVVIMNSKDNVATALRDLIAGEELKLELGMVLVKDNIPFGHKIAVRDIKFNSEVVKYGEPIGKTTKKITIGEHTHVHNVDGCRGRGDQKKEEVND